jgi:para-nitrobenzyl esterase
MDDVVSLAQGRVRGRREDGVVRFLGIPYAAAPRGAQRFQAPAPPAAWTGVREAGAFGPTPPKPPYPPGIADVLPEVEVSGEEWLSVNVWTPDPGGAGLPVMVWIHGGAFTNGNSALPVYDGRAFARDGVVLVSLNYRLGVIGFAHLPSAPDNRGLLDQIAALEWVRDNIAAFGGDPARVTVFGESAGAMSITNLFAMPRARGLFTRAVTQSGATQAAATRHDAGLVSAALGAALGAEPTAAGLAELPTERILAAQVLVRNALAATRDPDRFGATVVAASMAFLPVIDGEVLPGHPAAAIGAGAGAGVTLLTGTNTDEDRLFLVPTGIAAATDEAVLAGVAAAHGWPPAAVALYRKNRPDATPGEVLCALLSDGYFRLPAFEVARARQAHRATTYLYEFAQPDGAGDLGACHALEVAYVFDTLGTVGGSGLYRPGASQAVASAMHAAWVHFAHTGDPGWPAFDETYPVMVFADPVPTLHRDPRGDERAAWG